MFPVLKSNTFSMLFKWSVMRVWILVFHFGISVYVVIATVVDAVVVEVMILVVVAVEVEVMIWVEVEVITFGVVMVVVWVVFRFK